MMTVYAWRLRDARSNARAELRRVEHALAVSPARYSSDKFVESALWTLSEDLQDQWGTIQSLETLWSRLWFWQVTSEHVAACEKIVQRCSEIIHMLWLAEQGLFHYLPDEFVERLNRRPTAKVLSRTSGSAKILQFPDRRVTR